MRHEDPLDLTAAATSQAEAQARRQVDEAEEASDVKWLLSSKRGRRIVWRLLDQSGVFRLSFDRNSMTMAFNEGNRNAGNRLLSLVHAQCPELYPVMLKEATHGSTHSEPRPPHAQ